MYEQIFISDNSSNLSQFCRTELGQKDHLSRQLGHALAICPIIDVGVGVKNLTSFFFFWAKESHILYKIMSKHVLINGINPYLTNQYYRVALCLI